MLLPYFYGKILVTTASIILPYILQIFFYSLLNKPTSVENSCILICKCDANVQKYQFSNLKLC